MQVYFKIYYDGDLNQYIIINLDRLPDGSIHIRQTYLIQRIINIIPDMDKSSSKTTITVMPPLAKNREIDQERMTLTTS